MGIQDGWIAFDNDLNSLLAALLNEYVVSGMAVAEDAPLDMGVVVAAGTYYANGQKVVKGSETDLPLDASDPSDPRKDLVVGDSAGTISFVKGTAAPARPSTETGPTTYQPIPEDIPSGKTLLGEVWVGAGVNSIVDANITDRRVVADKVMDTEIVNAAEFPGATPTDKVQAALDSLPGSRGVVLVPASLSGWDATSVTIPTNALVIDYATSAVHPILWSGSGDFEYMLCGWAANGNAPYFVLNNWETDPEEAHSPGIVARHGSQAAPQNLWQLVFGNYGNAVAGINADDMVLYGWQPIVDWEQGNLSYTTENSDKTFTDDGQNFGSWDTPSGSATYKIRVKNDDDSLGWGWLGPLVSATEVKVYQDQACTVTGWNGTDPGGKTPEEYQVVYPMGQVSRLILGQNGVWIFNPDSYAQMCYDPLAAARAGYSMVLGSGDVGSTTRLLIGAPVAGGYAGIDLRAGADAKRKRIELVESDNSLRVLDAALTGTILLLTDAGNLQIPGEFIIDATSPVFRFKRGGAHKWAILQNYQSTDGLAWYSYAAVAPGVKLDFTKEGIIDHRGTMGNSAKDPTTDAPVDWVECQIGGVTRYSPVYAA